MQKAKVFCFLVTTVFLIFTNAYTQDIEFESHTIDTNGAGATSIFAIDMNDDGDMDVLAVSGWDGNFAWFENDGCEIFTEHTITTNADGATSIYAIDVDGDGDIDVLSACSVWNGVDNIAWYENDGDGNFIEHFISINVSGPKSVYAIDVDGDGDIDALSASYQDDKIAWYENDGDENFTEHTITTNANYAQSVYAIDMDGDGDIDVLSNDIAWYENDGYENFTEHTITTNAVNSVYAIDMDDDGDVDVYSCTNGGGALAPPGIVSWYENDGDENFIDHIITSSNNGGRSVYAVDINGDINIDVLVGIYDNSFRPAGICWYENDGEENYNEYIISENPANSIYGIDMENDGDMDVLTAYSDWAVGEIVWYENLQITGINDPEIPNSSLLTHNLNNYPNPFNPSTTIEYSIPQDNFVSLSIYNIKGQKIKDLSQSLCHPEPVEGRGESRYSAIWDGKDENGKSVCSGIYLYKLKTDNFEKTKKMILLK